MTETFTPVDQERIEAVLDGFNLKHFRGDDGTTRTAFPGLVLFFQIAEFGFKISTRWMATVRSAEDIQTLRIESNNLNRAMPLIRLHPITRDDGTAVLLIEAPFFTTVGVTDDQLREMLSFYFSGIHHVADQMRGHLPHISDELPGDPESEA